jgi:hypothetical protein
LRTVCGPGSVSTLSSRAPFPEAPLAAGGVFSWATCPHLNSGASQFPFQSRRGHQKANRPCPRPGFIRKLSDVRNWQRRPPILWSGLSWRNSADCGSRSPRRKRARMSGGRRRRSRRAHPHGLHQRGCELSGLPATSCTNPAHAELRIAELRPLGRGAWSSLPAHQKSFGASAMNAIMAERTNRLASTWPPTTTGAAPRPLAPATMR